MLQRKFHCQQYCFFSYYRILEQMTIWDNFHVSFCTASLFETWWFSKINGTSTAVLDSSILYIQPRGNQAYFVNIYQLQFSWLLAIGTHSTRTEEEMYFLNASFISLIISRHSNVAIQYCSVFIKWNSKLIFMFSRQKKQSLYNTWSGHGQRYVMLYMKLWMLLYWAGYMTQN